MSRANVFSIGEWYHCYNRGVDKRKIFLERNDYERFLALLYFANSPEAVHLEHKGRGRTSPSWLDETQLTERQDTLVDIGAYCLMSNHFHLVLRERTEGGITTFMRKVGTGYTMYFNKRNERTGPLLGGKFRARHVSDEQYLKRVINYVHANPVEITEPEWKEGIIRNEAKTKDFLRKYNYSSLPAYTENSCLDPIPNKELVLDLFDHFPNIDALLEDAITFATEKEEEHI